MKIENLRSEKRMDKSRVAATVSWEECNRPTQEVYFETKEEFADDLTCNPHAFLVASAIPAMHYGEKRVFIDAEICPELRNGLITAMSWLRHWYYTPGCEFVRIEAKTRTRMPASYPAKRAGLFFSGGIDSLATLRANRLNFPPEHPGSIKDGLIIYGLNIESDNRMETFEQAVAALSDVTRDACITLIPVYTNVRCLNTDTKFFEYEFHGAILASVAHTFVRRLTTLYVSSTDDIPSLALTNQQSFKPFGSHPLLDPNYSSNEMRILHDGITLSRLMKMKLIADWDVALQNIKVCVQNWPGMNCGKCRKCVLTMLGLMAVGKLDKTRAFPSNNISDELIKTVRLTKPRARACGGFDYGIEQNSFQELINPLAEIGRHDLAQAIKYMIKQFRYIEPAWKAMVKQFYRIYFKNNLVRSDRA